MRRGTTLGLMIFSRTIAACIGLASPAAAEMFDCVINPAIILQVGGPVAGLLDEVFVDQGDLLSKGQKIATLRSEVEVRSLEVLAIQAESHAEIEAQQSRLTFAQIRLARVNELVERNISPREDLEAAEAEAEVVARELAIAEMRQRVAQLELERARLELSQREILSPVDGVVLTRHLFDGEYLSQDSPVVTLARIDPLHVEVYLPVTYFRSVTPGMTLQVVPDAPFDGSYVGQVTIVDRVFDAASGTFGIRIVLDNPDLSIPAGHRCHIELTQNNQ
jgi:RND family efflux transporter MFP subunit